MGFISFLRGPIPMLITVLHDSKENGGEREREEKMEMEFSLEWKVERES